VNRRLDGGPAVNPNDVAAPERTRPDRALENAELEKALDGAIAALPPRQRIAFILQRYEQLASSEIASIMRIRTNAVDALLHRARTTLRTRLLRQYQEFLDQ
jgi:RNA polymerase sigma-70 factor (ECF subfamily)